MAGGIPVIVNDIARRDLMNTGLARWHMTGANGNCIDRAVRENGILQISIKFSLGPEDEWTGAERDIPETKKRDQTLGRDR